MQAHVVLLLVGPVFGSLRNQLVMRWQGHEPSCSTCSSPGRSPLPVGEPPTDIMESDAGMGCQHAIIHVGMPQVGFIPPMQHSVDRRAGGIPPQQVRLCIVRKHACGAGAAAFAASSRY